MKFYYLGPEGTYSEACAKKVLDKINKYFKIDNLTPISTIAKIVDIVDKDDDAMAILPIENMIEGIVRQTIDNIYENDVKIQLQTELPINHCLVSKGDKKDIKHIVSHPQALSQCQKYILDNFDEKIDLINANSTAYAFNYILDKDKSYAAICSPCIIKDKTVNIIDKNIGDIKENATRFIIISKKDLNLGEKTRTSIVFNTKNEPGALLKVLNIFSKHDLNLVYLESRPSKRVFGEYNFFLDIDKGYNEIYETLQEVKKECNYYKLLGSYPII